MARECAIRCADLIKNHYRLYNDDHYDPDSLGDLIKDIVFLTVAKRAEIKFFEFESYHIK